MTSSISSQAHTTGPWTVHIEDQEGIKYLVVDDSGLLVAKIARDHTHTKMQPANARLIAAAPDLLAALKFALTSPDEDAALKMAEAAIAKAQAS